MVREHQHEHAPQWSAIESVAAKIGCTVQTLCNWVRQAKRDAGARAELSTAERDRLKALERESRQLRQASAYFAQAELDRRPKSRGPSSTRTAARSGSSRTGPWRGRSGMKGCFRRSSGSGGRTCRSTGPTKCGGNWAGKASRSPDTRSSD